MQIEGIAELASAVEQYSATLQEQFTTRLQEIGQTAYNDMEGNSPVDTGFLQSSWSFTPDELGFTIDNSCEYCGFVEFGHSTRGTSYVPGQNWITPAYEAMRAEIESLIQEVSAGSA